MSFLPATLIGKSIGAVGNGLYEAGVFPALTNNVIQAIANVFLAIGNDDDDIISVDEAAALDHQLALARGYFEMLGVRSHSLSRSLYGMTRMDARAAVSAAISQVQESAHRVGPVIAIGRIKKSISATDSDLDATMTQVQSNLDRSTHSQVIMDSTKSMSARALPTRNVRENYLLSRLGKMAIPEMTIALSSLLETASVAGCGGDKNYNVNARRIDFVNSTMAASAQSSAFDIGDALGAATDSAYNAILPYVSSPSSMALTGTSTVGADATMTGFPSVDSVAVNGLSHLMYLPYDVTRTSVTELLYSGAFEPRLSVAQKVAGVVTAASMSYLAIIFSIPTEPSAAEAKFKSTFSWTDASVIRIVTDQMRFCEPSVVDTITTSAAADTITFHPNWELRSRIEIAERLPADRTLCCLIVLQPSTWSVSVSSGTAVSPAGDNAWISFRSSLSYALGSGGAAGSRLARIPFAEDDVDVCQVIKPGATGGVSQGILTNGVYTWKELSSPVIGYAGQATRGPAYSAGSNRVTGSIYVGTLEDYLSRTAPSKSVWRMFSGAATRALRVSPALPSFFTDLIFKSQTYSVAGVTLTAEQLVRALVDFNLDAYWMDGVSVPL